jgi:nicotinamidase-related amidase
MSNCLVIIDVQNGFIYRNTKYVVKRILTLAKKQKFDHIVATRFVNHDGSPHDKLLHWRKVMDKKSQAIPEEITKIAERTFDKDCYSCFTPEFCKFVEKNDIDKLYFVGVDTDCCVLKSAADAFERGIRPIVVAKCCASHGGGLSHRAGLRVLKRLTGQSIIKKTESIK